MAMKNIFATVQSNLWIIQMLVAMGIPLLSSAQNNVQIVFEASKNKSLSISSIVRNGVAYAPVDELSKALGLRLQVHSDQRKTNLQFATKTVTMTASNPFLLVHERASGTIADVYQMPQETIHTSNGFFTPLHAFSDFLSLQNLFSISFDQKKMTLTVGKKKESDATVSNPIASSNKSALRAVVHTISHLTVEARRNGLLLRIHCTKNLRQFESSLPKPNQLLVDIHDATVDSAELAQTPSASEITQLRVAQRPHSVRLAFTLQSEYESCDITKDAQTNDLLIALYQSASVDSIYAAEMQAKKKTIDQKRTKWKLDAIIIDAGHGGKDPGTIGVTGIKEKNIALGIALKLGKLIETNMKNVRVIYTRKNDTFIELDRRGQIANEEQGKLFVSIHCNATPQKPSNAHGFEVYLLRPGRTEEAIHIAEVENSVIKLEKDYEKRYAKLTNENFILINMAQSSYMKYSERVAELLHRQVVADNTMKSLGVKQAGFLVLVGASMPGVLIETGFLSNAKEEKRLASQEGQQRIAENFFKAIEKYSREYDRSIDE